MLITFKFPKQIRLYSHKEYEPHKITPRQAKKQHKKFILEIPTSNKNSPIKLLEPGKAMLAIVNKQKNEE